ncbi:unnamed protein product, partial [Coregonus sp. 'balchen']
SSPTIFITIIFVCSTTLSQLFRRKFPLLRGIDLEIYLDSPRVCLSLILWNGIYTQEKIIIQWTLLSEACYFAIQFLVTSVTLVEIGSLPNAAILLLLSRVLFLLVTLLYYYHLGKGRPKKI